MSFMVDVRLPIEFCVALFRLFAGDATFSLEGHFAAICSELEPIALSTDETSALKRNTLKPRLDFCVFALLPTHLETIERLLPRLGVRKNIIHMQIERQGKLVFGAYDSFSDVFVDDLESAALDGLQSRRVIRGYRSRDIEQKRTGPDI